MNKGNDNHRVEKCPSCNKAMTKVGRYGKWRCRNPRCTVIMVQVGGN